jgi:DNA-binding NtrC family response regulator
MSDAHSEIERRRIAALENDLFFAVKIQDTLKQTGFQTRVMRTNAEFRELLTSGGYALALVNTAARGIDWRLGVMAAREAGVPVIAYGPHVDLDTQTEARAIGATRVIANSRLADLPSIVERVIARVGGQVAQSDDLTASSRLSDLSADEQTDE